MIRSSLQVILNNQTYTLNETMCQVSKSYGKQHDPSFRVFEFTPEDIVRSDIVRIYPRKRTIRGTIHDIKRLTLSISIIKDCSRSINVQTR